MIFVVEDPSLYSISVSTLFPHHCLQCGENQYASSDKRLTLQCIYASMPFPLMPLCTGLFVCTLLVAGLHVSLCLHCSVLQHRPLFQLLSALPSSSATILACRQPAVILDFALILVYCYTGLVYQIVLCPLSLQLSVLHSHTGITKSSVDPFSFGLRVCGTPLQTFTHFKFYWTKIQFFYGNSHFHTVAFIGITCCFNGFKTFMRCRICFSVII